MLIWANVDMCCEMPPLASIALHSRQTYCNMFLPPLTWSLNANSWWSSHWKDCWWRPEGHYVSIHMCSAHSLQYPLLCYSFCVCVLFCWRRHIQVSVSHCWFLVCRVCVHVSVKVTHPQRVVCVWTCVCVLFEFLTSYPSKRRLLVDSMALSTLRMACSMEVLTKVSPSLLTAGTVVIQRQTESLTRVSLVQYNHRCGWVIFQSNANLSATKIFIRSLEICTTQCHYILCFTHMGFSML